MLPAAPDHSAPKVDAGGAAATPARGRRPTRSAAVPWGSAVLGVATGLLLGLGIMYPRLGRSEAESARVSDMLTVTRLKLRLTSAVIDVQRGAFDDAAGQLRAFYAGAEQAAADEIDGPHRVTGPRPVHAALRHALEQRAATLALVDQRDARAVPALLEQLEALRRAAPDGRPRP